MRRFVYGMLMALALPCLAAEPTGHQEWLRFKQELDRQAGGPTGMYAIQNMIELSAGQTARLPANVTVKFADQRAMVSGPGVQPTDLLALQGKALPLVDGLAVKATLLRERALKVWIYDAKLPEQRKFKALEFFPYDSKGRITAPFRRNDKPVAVSYLDSRERAGTMYEVGVIDAVIDGKKQPLKAFSYRNDWQDIDALLLLLRDRTSGKTTYGGGRVVEIAIPKGAPPAELTFDLNLAYSFLCAHSEFYNCPLVLTNRVDADLTYGEKYPPRMTGE